MEMVLVFRTGDVRSCVFPSPLPLPMPLTDDVPTSAVPMSSEERHHGLRCSLLDIPILPVADGSLAQH